MKKLFLIVLAIYLLPVVVAEWSWQYIEKTGVVDFLYAHWLPVLLSIVIVSALFYWLAYKAFAFVRAPKYRKFIVFAAIAFLFLVFIGNTGYIKFINNYTGSSERITIIGTVTNKYKIIKRKKQDSRTIEVTETGTGRKYLFKVRLSAYLLLEEGSEFNKEFTKGSLGILFRKEK